MTIKERAGLLPENPKDKKRASVIAKSKRQSLVGTDAEQSYAVSWSPILYRLPETSIAWQVVKRMFPDRSAGAEDGSRTTTTWKELVTAMGALGFVAEPNGGSMYRFGGDIMVPVPNANPKRQKRKLGVHRLHACGDMQPNFLQALGRRCNKNFGWERDLFVTTEDMT